MWLLTTRSEVQALPLAILFYLLPILSPSPTPQKISFFAKAEKKKRLGLSMIILVLGSVEHAGDAHGGLTYLRDHQESGQQAQHYCL